MVTIQTGSHPNNSPKYILITMKGLVVPTASISAITKIICPVPASAQLGTITSN